MDISSAKLAEKGLKYIKAQLEKDAANRYSLKEDWTLPLIDFDELPAGEYDGPVVHLASDGRQVLLWYSAVESTAEINHCDGATGVPDVLLGIDLRPGAFAHDTGYDEMEDIAKAFGVPVSVVRKLFDKAFASVTLAENEGRPGVRVVTSAAYAVVRAVGGVYHASGRGALKAAKGVATAILAALLLDCAGCVTTSFVDPGDYRSPMIEKVQ